MNREILFRGKRIDSGVWLYGSLRQYKDGTSGICDRELEHTYRVDPNTVGEYTGMTDKNGKKIFEGDILRFGERRLVVWWNGEAFQWQAKTVAGYDYIPYEVSHTDWTNVDLGLIYSEIPILGRMTTEVIGNIHDNSELMEGE